MKLYKVEITQTEKYIIDVQAENEEQAKELATPLWNTANENGTEHYFSNGDIEIDFGTVYDVTGTDDDAFLKEDLEEVAELEEKLTHNQEWTNQ